MREEGFHISKRIALFWITLSVLFSLSLWFSSVVILPDLKSLWSLTPRQEFLLLSSIPAGFVLDAFVSSFFSLPDRYNPRFIFALSAFCGSVLNAMLLLTGNGFLGIFIRFLTGVTLAGIYPVAVKLIAQWFPTRRGLSIGILFASLTLGSSLPHLLGSFSSVLDWRFVIGSTSLLSLFSSIFIYFFLHEPPTKTLPPISFSFKRLKDVLSNRPVMLANYGYFGHMWELYAMWTWLPLFLYASFISFSPNMNPLFSLFSAFLCIGVAGAIGCVLGGVMADKIGKAKFTIIAMGVSGSCAVAIGFTFGKPPWVTLLVALIWGGFVIADSAQFSASVSEFSEPEYVGTAVTFQMCIGFLITILTINLIAFLHTFMGWKFIFVILSIGPCLGIVSMWRLKSFEKTLLN